MASQRQFDGPVLEDLLERVRAEVGPDARIVAANRVRKGGVGGFFARQAYEVLVEPAETTPGQTPATQPAPAAQQTTAPTTGRTTSPAIAMPAAATTASALLAAPSGSHTPLTILELADAVSDDERSNIIDLVEDRRVSTESRDFAQVLDRFSRSIDATPEEIGRDIATPLESRPSDEIDLRTSHQSATRVAGSPAPDVFESGVSESALPRPAEPNESSEPSEPALRPNDGTDLVMTLGSTPVPRGTRPPTQSAEVIDRYETRLARMGLPARLIPRGVAQYGLKGALVESLIRLPPAPTVPAAFGVVIATVGVGAAPVLLARDLATELGIDPDDVMLATRELLGGGVPAWLQMCDPATAEERRLSWRRRGRPTIVACSLPTATTGLHWARDMLDHLEPTVTWAIVDAGSKREDIAFRIEELGGVDVLALEGLDDTISPATALEIGVPVGRLEQEHASPLTWTELLLERLHS